MNPFKKVDVNEIKKNYTKELRELFKDKKAGDSFAIPNYKYKTHTQIRAIMFDAFKDTSIKYKTKVSDGVLYVLVLEK